MPALSGSSARRLPAFDEALSSAALLLMVLIPVAEIVVRPWLGSGIENAPVVVQHLGLVLAMWGGLAAERHGHLSALAGRSHSSPELKSALAHAIAALICTTAATAQTAPKIKNTGYEQTKTVMYVGNSFYYYNDSMHSKVLGLNSAADPQNRNQYRSTSALTPSGR